MTCRWIAAIAFGACVAPVSLAAAAEQLSLQFGWIPGGERAHYYLAKDAGYFAAEGLDVRLIPGKGAADALTKVATGAADIGEGGLDDLLTAKVHNVIAVKAVMPVYTLMPDALMTAKTSGIKGLADVEGKTVATATFTSSNGPWPFLLRQNGVNPDKVTLIKTDPNALVPMLATGRVDAIIRFAHAGFAVERAFAETKKELVVIPWSQYGLTGYSNSVYASEKTLATRRDAIVRFIRALKKAEEATRDNPALAAAALKKLVPEADLQITEEVTRAALRLLFNENTTRDGLGVFSPDLVKATWGWVVKTQNVAPDKLDPLAAIDFSFGSR